MDRRLIIHHFGAIKQADICLKDYNIFIGEQGSGKSTIAKLVTIFEDCTPLLSQSANLDLLPMFEEYNIASYFHADTYICFVWENGTLYYRDGKFIYELFAAETASASVRNLYIPAERFFVSTFSRTLATLLLSKAPIPNTLLNFASVYEKAKKRFPGYNVPLFNLLFKTDEARETLHLPESGRAIPFKDASSGIQSVIPLLMVLDYATEEREYGQFIIEEPELNLFPESQVKLLQQIVCKCSKVTLTTHSPYLLSALNNLIEAGNVLKSNPNKAEEVYTLIPKECVLSFANVGAYKIKGGNVLSILDEEYQMIVADQIDEVADEESRIFSQLLNLENL